MSFIVTPPYPAIPHFAWPFTVDTFEQRVEVAEQDSTGEIGACIASIVYCPVGAVPELPGFGVPDVSFSQTPVSTTAFVDAIVQWEPRVTTETVSEFMDFFGNSAVQIQIPYTGDPQQLPGG